MSGLYENLPFARGNTYGTTDLTVGTQYEGKEYIHEDRTYGTARFVRVRIVRNNSGATLAGKYAAKFDNTVAGRAPDTYVSGKCTVTAERSYIIDDLLTGTVPDKDLFYVVMEGPCLARTDLAAGATTVITVNDYLHALTAATTGATTAGRVNTAVFTGATAVLAGQIQNVIGRAMSAKTTANTNADVLIDAGRF